MHWDISKQEHQRDLSGDGADDVKGLQLNQLIALELEIFFHPRYVGIVYANVSQVQEGGNNYTLKLD